MPLPRSVTSGLASLARGSDHLRSRGRAFITHLPPGSLPTAIALLAVMPWLPCLWGDLAGGDSLLARIAALGLHATAALLFHDVLRRLIPPGTAAIAAALFAVHPVHAEIIASPDERGALVAFAFALLTLRIALADGAPRLRRGVAAAATAATAALFDPVSVAVVAVAAALIVRPRTRTWRLGLLGPLAGGAALGWIGHALAATGGRSIALGPAEASGLTRALRVLGADVPRRFSDPRAMGVDPLFSSSGATTATGAVLLGIAVLAAVAFARRGRHGVARWVVCYTAALTPFLPPFASQPTAARDLFGGAALFPALAAGLALAPERWAIRRVVVFTVITLAALLSIGRARAWQSNEALWEAELALGQESPEAHLRIGRLRREGRDDGERRESEIRHLEAGLAAHPDHPGLLVRRAEVALEEFTLGRRRAYEIVGRLREIAPEDPSLLRLRARLERQAKRSAEAERLYGEARALDPGDVESRIFLAERAFRRDELGRAEILYREAIDSWDRERPVAEIVVAFERLARIAERGALETSVLERLVERTVGREPRIDDAAAARLRAAAVLR